MKVKITVITAIFAVAGLFMSSALVANAQNGGMRAGWGLAVENHTHVGPAAGTSVVPPTSHTPVVTGITAPTTLDVDEEGIWSLKTVDPLDGSLTYSVDWGEPPSLLRPLGLQANFEQTSTFSHAYSVAGIYTVTFTVENEEGLSTHASVTVKVGTDAEIAEAAAERAAQIAVSAYEAGPLTTLDEVAAAEALKTPADNAVALVQNMDVHDALAKRITVRAAAIALARTAIEAEASAVAAAAHAVAAYEAGPLTTLDEVAAAEALKAPADAAVALVRNASVHDAFAKRISKRADEIAAARTALEHTPVITGVDAPDTLDVGEEGTWTLTTIDPLDGSLTYSVDWGDTPATLLRPQDHFEQTSTFSHVYSAPGEYTITFTVENEEGQIARTSVTVEVGDPNGGGSGNDANEAVAETAVGAYEAAPLSTLDEVAAAEALKEPAESAVEAVQTPDVHDALASRISARAAEITAARAELEAVATETAAEAAAQTAVAAYEQSSLATLKDVSAAEALKAPADAAVALVLNLDVHDTMAKRITDRAAVIAAARTALEIGNQNPAVVISGLKVTGNKKNNAQINWRTNVNADSQVWVSTVSPVDTSGSPQASKSKAEKNHKIKLDHLNVNTTYYVVVRSKDGKGNIVSSEITFTTKKK
jgi:PKD repeat protein